MIDVSDGLVRDARRIAAGSGVGLDLDPDLLAPGDQLVAVSRALGADALDWMLTGGEDHALLATFPADSPLPEGYRTIGGVVPSGDADVLVAGRPWSGSGGFTHFGG
jgi:thiamine-monophosphate kinase